jgi:gluconolactonase
MAEIAIDARTTALVIQDLQNDTVSEGGAFADTGSYDHATAQDVVANVARLAGAARAAGIPVIHIWYIVEEGARGLQLNAPLYRGIKDSGAVVRGSWGAAPAAGLEPQEGDFVVEKTRMNGFYGTRLDPILRALDTETLIITGAWTNMSIEHTARHAADAGYRAVVVSDGTSTMNADWHRAAIEYALTNVAEIVTVSDLVNAIEGSSNASAAD